MSFSGFRSFAALIKKYEHYIRFRAYVFWILSEKVDFFSLLLLLLLLFFFCFRLRLAKFVIITLLNFFRDGIFGRSCEHWSRARTEYERFHDVCMRACVRVYLPDVANPRILFSRCALEMNLKLLRVYVATTNRVSGKSKICWGDVSKIHISRQW